MVAQPDEPDWPAHEAVAAALANATVPLRARSVLYPGEQESVLRQWLAAVRGSPPDVTASLLLLLIRRAADEGGWSSDTAERVQRLGRVRWTMPAREAAYAVRIAAALPDTWSAADVLCCAVSLAQRADPPSEPDLRAALALLAGSARERDYLPAAKRATLLRELELLTARPARGVAVGATLISEAGIEPGDGWSAAVFTALDRWDGDLGPASALLCHLRGATGRKPTRAWLDSCAELAGQPGAARLVEVLLEAALTAPGAVTADRFGWGLANLVVSARNAVLLRAAAWAASTVNAEWVIPVLRDLAARAAAGTRETGCIESAAVPAACTYGLGLIASPAAIAALAALRGGAQDRDDGAGAMLRGQVDSALVVAARRAALAPDELAEHLAGCAGLTAAGERLVTAGELTARLTITADWQVTLRWRTRRGWSPSPPAAASGAARQLVSGAAREVSQALAGERARLERLLAQDRRWPVADWRVRYCEHPVTRTLAAGLIWIIEPESPGDEPLTGMPAAPGLLITVNGPRPVPQAGQVRLWHPVSAEPAEVAAWRDVVAASACGQPFSQAFREVYPATADERLPAVKATSRFEGRLLRYPQAHAWLTEHGWAARYLEPFSGVTDGRARRDFPGAGLAALFEHAVAGADPADLCAEFCRTGRLAFHRIKGGARTPVRLSRVSSLVFSEAVRDLELLVAAAEAVG